MSHKPTPDHHDADLVLKLYDLRREPVMRQSRQVMADFLPRSFADVQAVLQPTHPHNAAYRQVSSYFEMAYGMARHGIVNADYLAENTGEGLLLFAKLQPFLAELRGATSPFAFQNAEWLLQNSAAAQQRFQVFQARIARALAAAR